MIDRLQESTRVIELFKQRTALLRAISEVNSNVSIQGEDEILERCCKILIANEHYCLVWAGRRDKDDTTIMPIAAINSVKIENRDCMRLIQEVVLDMDDSNPAARALQKGSPVLIQDITREEEQSPLGKVARETGFQSCLSWPLIYKQREYGVLTIHSEVKNCFQGPELDFLGSVVADISLALYSQETSQYLQVERDFNQELVDTVQGLLVSVSPGGKVLSMNHKAEQITGFSQQEVINGQWTEILLAPEDQKKNQHSVAHALQNNLPDINFQASLVTRGGDKRVIDWHGSFRPNITKGKVGMVLFGIDKTDQIKTDQTLHQVLAQWENIFSTIQDPALIVSADNIILDANSATFTAARKPRQGIIGKRICQILHGEQKAKNSCPLETLVRAGKSRIIETELQGFNGQYMLTISPLSSGQGDLRLLVARDLTDEALSKAEAMRAAQLASIGELAAGVAHEINNPINGIINYAQLLLDDLANKGTNSQHSEKLKQIIVEGTRIGSIAHKLLDFARGHEERFEAVTINQLVDDCLDLVGHQLMKDGIAIMVDLQKQLPTITCNRQQIQQVLLNIFSNARYALNKKYNAPDPKKSIILTAEKTIHDQTPYLTLTITDYGTGIEHDLMDRLFNPFFSTKPKGEGTGLGLSISHGLIQDNNGYLRVQSKFGEYTSLIVGLPTYQPTGEKNGR